MESQLHHIDSAARGRVVPLVRCSAAMTLPVRQKRPAAVWPLEEEQIVSPG